MIAPQDFVDDAPWEDASGALAEIAMPDLIEGVRLQRLVTHRDGRGDLTVLASARYDAGFSTPHVYLITALPGSVRAWVFHKRQSDRLAYWQGSLRVALYDIRPDSPTRGRLNVLDLGAACPAVLTIPPFVAHGVQNRGRDAVSFVNMPTRAYDPARPDKSRLKYPHPSIPYVFD